MPHTLMGTTPSLQSLISVYQRDAPISEASTIPSTWYTDPRVLGLERQTVFARAWQVAGRVEQLERPGQFVTCETAGGEPIVLVRGNDGVLRGFFNVCRHHAAAVVTTAEGSASHLRCPYHGWTYALDGALKGTPEFTGVCNFNRSTNGLVPADIVVWEKWVFVRTASNGGPSDFPEPALTQLFPSPTSAGLQWMERRAYTVDCNWKVFVDNYLDGGYHVPHLHKGLDSVLDYTTYTIENGSRFCLQSSSMSASGADARTGAVRTGDRALYLWLYPNFMINCYADTMDTNLVIPRGPDRTDVIFDFYFADVSEAARSRNLESIAVSEQIQEEDVAVCASVQRGLRSRAYEAGRLSVRREAGEHLFHQLLYDDLMSGLLNPTTLMPASPGTRFGPYEIVKPIGAGGMGEVYEARDTRLDRPVAIKVLPPELAADAAARARFDREARAIAALNHPNICALHDIGDADGHGFLVMERLEGETLQQRLQRGPLDIEQTIDYGIALADALDAAHGRSLIHRDLKPANVFITTRGIVRILDFGLAKSVLESDADVTRSLNESLTSTGTTLGTVAYMSPEQLRGEPLDVRTDLFSFGLVLYEMATGERAFGGSTVVVAAAGILSQQPPAPRVLRAEVPEGLERSILKALEKDRARRYQSADELRADLMDVKRGAVPAHRSLGEGGLAVAPAAPVHSGAAPPLLQPRRSRFRSVVFALCLTAIAFALVDSLRRDQPPSPGNNGRQELRPAGRISPPPARDAEPVPPPSPAPEPPRTPPVPESNIKPRPTQPADAIEPVTANKNGAPTGPDITSRVPSGAPPTQDPGPLPSALPGNAPFGGRARAGRSFGAAGATLLKTLRSAPPETFDLVYASNDLEARTMALQLRTLLTTAGWTNASTTELAAPQAKVGIFAPKVTPGVSALTTWARRQGLQPDIRQVPTLPHPRIVIGRQE